MIRIDTVRLENFRGAKKLTLQMGGRNFAIQGANGTGKSGVVDAIEFALTGDVTRLSGRGMGGVSVKAHAPHVDARDGSDDARVMLTGRFVDTDEIFTIQRNVKDSKHFAVTPDTATSRDRLNAFSDHPEFALSRREILKYVITEPGERAKEVQSLLRLDAVEKIRANFKTIANSAKSELQHHKSTATSAAANLRTALQISELSPTAVLAAVNERRSLLGLDTIETLTGDTLIKEGVTIATMKTPVVNKTVARKELDELLGIVRGNDSLSVTDGIGRALEILQELAENASLLFALKSRDFLDQGLSLIAEDSCPFCDHEWDVDHLRSHVREKLAQAKHAQELHDELDHSCRSVSDALIDLARRIEVARGYGRKLLDGSDFSLLEGWVNKLRDVAVNLTKTNAIEQTRDVLKRGWRQVPEGAYESLQSIKEAVASLPDVSAADAAREYLIEGQVRLGAYRTAHREHERAEKRSALATTVLEKYADRSTAILSGIYSAVEKDFSRYYAIVNREDESQFHAELKPASGKLDLQVEFYGRGLFPPAAYHSEGHQDGMGLCLYLALMRHLLGDSFTFAVLDDVLMSVDAGHRKEVCRLLASEFPNTQFIFTTHDRVWLQHMVAEGVIDRKAAAQFRRWTVDDGPRVWDSADVWAEIDEDLANDDVPAAAGCLRRYLEFTADDLSINLRASIERQPEASYDLGDLLPPVIGKFKKLLGLAKGAANSWNQKDLLSELAAREAEFDEAYRRSNVEQWAINASVHYNAWMNLQPDEFREVAEAFRTLVAKFECPACHGYIAVTPRKGQADGLRCPCNSIAINLKPKP